MHQSRPAPPAQGTMDVAKLNSNLQSLKEQLRNLMAASAELIERNSKIDSSSRNDSQTNNPPKFELMLEDFLSSCNMIELYLRTMQESLHQGLASMQNLPISISNLKCDSLDGRSESIEPKSIISYNQYNSVIRHQIDTANEIKSILDEFVKQLKIH